MGRLKTRLFTAKDTISKKIIEYEKLFRIQHREEYKIFKNIKKRFTFKNIKENGQLLLVRIQEGDCRRIQQERIFVMVTVQSFSERLKNTNTQKSESQ